MKKNTLQAIKDFIFFPVRFFFNHDTVRKLGLTSLQDERFNVCMPYIKGKVLDIGCGEGNKFIKKLGYGIGLDPYFKNGADVAAKAEKMPFPDKKFQTITMMGSLNYIKDRDKAMKEIHRILTDDGLVLILANSPFFNTIRQALIWWCPYNKMKAKKGFVKKEIINLADANQFKLIKTRRYVYKLSVMYILTKAKKSIHENSFY